jgi:chemotaxis protein histidine kinase CheA
MVKVKSATEERLEAANERMKILLQGKAYQMFYEELSRSVQGTDNDLLQKINGQTAAPDDATTDDMADLRRRFHALKGSSGFFGFTQIKATAGKLEDILTALEPNAIDALQDARNLVTELQRLAGELPPPKSKD